MDLQTFYQRQTSVAREEFAKAIGTSLGYYRNVVSGFRRPNETLALAIERESKGIVTVAELRADFADALIASGYAKRKARAA